MSDQSPIRVYVACLASYNTGILHGAWIDATQGENHLRKATQDMLKRSPMSNAEEWAIHDHEGLPNASVQEHSSFTKIAGLASFMEDHGRLGEAILAYYSGSLDDARDALTERYQGQFESL
ncbi:MAG: antirestriction protein ArdA, partial [Pseudomonadota bacterium]